MGFEMLEVDGGECSQELIGLAQLADRSRGLQTSLPGWQGRQGCVSRPRSCEGQTTPGRVPPLPSQTSYKEGRDYICFLLCFPLGDTPSLSPPSRDRPPLTPTPPSPGGHHRPDSPPEPQACFPDFKVSRTRKFGLKQPISRAAAQEDV